MGDAERAAQAVCDREAARRARQSKSASYLVRRLAREIKTALPGELLYVEREICYPQRFFHKPIPRALRDQGEKWIPVLTDFDLETRNAIIQVKSGSACDLAKELSHQMKVSATVTDKAVIGFAPGLSWGAVQWRRSHGQLVFRQQDELLAFLSSLAPPQRSANAISL